MNKKTLKKILFVDDDADILTIAKYALKTHPEFEVRYINSGEEAIQVALLFLPDLILLDVMMPKMDGISTLKALRARVETHDIPVAFFTAKVTKQEIYSYFEVGVIDVLIKPFDPIKLADALKNIWQTYQNKGLSN